MERRRLSSVDKNFMSSLRRYDESNVSRQSIGTGKNKSSQIQEKKIIIENIEANIRDLENGNYQKCYTSINLMFTDPHCPLRKHVTFQLFVPEEKDFFGYSILSSKDIWILLLLYFDLVNQTRNQYARHIWSIIVKKMAEYLNYELREEVITKVKIFGDKAKLNGRKSNVMDILEISELEIQQNPKMPDQICEEQMSKANCNQQQELCFDKSYLATLSDNSLIDRSQIQEQNLIFIQNQNESYTNEEISQQGPNNSSLDLNLELNEITYQSNSFQPNSFQLQEISLQQSSTEDIIKYSQNNDNGSQLIESSLLAQMEQLGIDNQQSELLNNAQIIYSITEEDGLDSNLGVSQLNNENIFSSKQPEINEQSTYKNNQFLDFQNQQYSEEKKQDSASELQEEQNDEQNQQNKINYISDFDKINTDSFNPCDNKGEQIRNNCSNSGETPHFQFNQLKRGNFLCWDDQQEMSQRKNYESEIINPINQEIYLAQSIMDEDKVQIDEFNNKEDELSDQEQPIVQLELETKQQFQEEECNQDFNLNKNEIQLNQDSQQLLQIHKSSQKTIFDYFKPKIESTQIFNIVEEHPLEISRLSARKKRNSRIGKLMRNTENEFKSSDIEIAEMEVISQNISKQSNISEEVLSSQLNVSGSENKKRQSYQIDKRIDKEYIEKHGSGFRYEVMAAPNRIKEQYQVEEILVPRRSSKRLSYPNKSDLEIQKMIIVNNEILNYFTPADQQSQQIKNEIQQSNISFTYMDSLKNHNQQQISVVINQVILVVKWYRIIL